ncbi:MAG: hypothetical protein JXX28_13940 [Deltaproteobacteria bacterium]|nr:hypothetical protein [Deltaproteobacteria bacterium]
MDVTEELTIPGYRVAARHQVLAALYDLWLAPTLMMIPIAFGLSVTGMSQATRGEDPILGLVALGIILMYLIGSVVVIGYHVVFSKRAGFATPGEQMAGAWMDGEVKRWRSPFTVSRWFLFLVVFLWLYWPGNAFDGILEYSSSPGKVVGVSVRVLAMTYSAIAIARGRFGWLVVPVFVLGLGLFQVWGATADPDPLIDWVTKLVASIMSGGVLAMLVGSWVYYRGRRV